jgi:hypothetical protein
MRRDLISCAVSRPMLYPEGNPAKKKEDIIKTNYY